MGGLTGRRFWVGEEMVSVYEGGGAELEEDAEAGVGDFMLSVVLDGDGGWKFDSQRLLE